MNIQTRLEPEVLEAVKKAAALEGTSLSEYLRRLLEADLEVRKGKNEEGREEAGEGESDRIR
jgi:hypothetical protein